MVKFGWLENRDTLNHNELLQISHEFRFLQHFLSAILVLKESEKVIIHDILK
jgi:hypothetical protein